MPNPRILGPDGRPIAVGEALREPQTARLVHLQREIQGHASRGLTPQRLAAILDAAEHGDLIAQAELYDDMEERDAHMASEMGKRRRALLLDWDVVAPDNPSAAETAAADALSDLLKQVPDLEDVIYDCTDAIGKGFACLEIAWQRDGRWWLPASITHRPQTWFTLHRGYRQEIRLRTHAVTDGVQGDPLQPLGWITHVHRAKSGYLERAALFRLLVWPYLFKSYSAGDLAEFLEVYGIPIKIGRYNSTATEAEKATLLRALAGIGRDAAGIVPEGMLIDFQAAATGDPDAFQLMIDWCERSQSKAILGGTLTSGADGKTSTNALGKVHDEVRKDLRDADIRQVNATLSRDLVYAIAAVNGLAPDGPRRCPVFRLNADEPEDLTKFADALPKLVAIGVRPTVQWAHERLGIPQAEGDEPVLGPPPAPPAPPGAGRMPQPGDDEDERDEDEQDPPEPAAANARRAAALPAVAQPAAQMAARLSAEMAPATDRWLEQVRDLVMQAQSLQDVRDGLEALLPELSLQDYADAMTAALAAARLAGRYEILQEAARGGLAEG